MKYLEGGKRDIAIIQDRKNGYSIDQMINGAKKAYATKGLNLTDIWKFRVSTARPMTS